MTDKKDNQKSTPPIYHMHGAAAEIIHKELERIRECQERYQHSERPPMLGDATLALRFLGTLNEQVAGWALEAITKAVAEEYKIEYDQMGDPLDAASWPPDALRKLIAVMADTMQIGLPLGLADSVAESLVKANAGIKPGWFLVGGEQSSERVKRRLSKRESRHEKKLIQKWFVGWVSFAGYRGENRRSTADAAWETLSEALDIHFETIKQWAKPSHSTSLDKYFEKGAIKKQKEWAILCKERAIEDGEGSVWALHFSESLFDELVAKYRSLDHPKPAQHSESAD